MQPWLPLIGLLTLAPLQAQEDPSPEPSAQPPTTVTTSEAIDRMRAFIDANPDGEHTTSARFRLAALYLDQAVEQGESPIRAANELELVVAAVEQGRAGTFSHAAEAWYLLGWCLRDAGPTRATQAWEHVVEHYPSSDKAPASMLHLGEAAMDQADWEQATVWFERAIASAPEESTRAQASYLAGWGYYKTDAWDQAEEAFVRVLQQDPGAPLRAEALEYLVLVLVDRCETQGLKVSDQLDAALAPVPADLRQAFEERTVAVLEGMARFDEADAVRSRNTTSEPWWKRAKRKE